VALWLVPPLAGTLDDDRMWHFRSDRKCRCLYDNIPPASPPRSFFSVSSLTLAELSTTLARSVFGTQLANNDLPLGH
jgi:hypothetical protein